MMRTQPATRGLSRMGQAKPGKGRLIGERLEDRLAPAVTASIIADNLVITTDDQAQRLLIDQDSTTGEIILRSAGLEIGRFAASNVQQIGITTGAGNDRIEISPRVGIPVQVDAGSGRDQVKGGGGNSTMVGGEGHDKLRSGLGNSLLLGGDGNDRLVAGLGPTTLNGGPGLNRLAQVAANDVVIPNPGDFVARIPDPIAALNAQLAAFSVPQETLTTDEVQILLDRASAATSSNDAIIAVVDRNGRILGVRVESGVAPEILNDTNLLVFAVDGAVSKARTGAFFGNNEAPLTSRTIRTISQSTITEREVNSNPNIPDPNSPLRGPGFVAPISPGGHFPPGITNTPQVDLFAIEHTNRDGTIHPVDGIRGNGNDVVLPQRFNINPAYVPPGQSLFPPDSYGFVSGLLPDAQNRGIATIPGGIPIVKNGQVVGGIGVFFPGKTGFASEENFGDQGALNDPSKPDRSLEAEFMAFAAVGGAPGSGFAFPGPIGNAPALPPGFTLPAGRIDLVGITLDIFGPGGLEGPKNLFRAGQALGTGQVSGQLLPVGRDAGGVPIFLKAGLPVPEGWLVLPHDGIGITAAEATQIVLNGLTQAFQTRAAIRLPAGTPARFVIAVADLEGNIIALYRTPDATVFSIDVAVAKARNVAYYANPLLLQPIDQIPGIPAGTAFSSRTFRYAAEPRFPEGIDGRPPGPFSIYLDGNVDPRTARQVGPPLPASAFTSVLGFDSFNPQTNFRNPLNPLNQNGIVFFPGSAPLYRRGFGGSGLLIGGIGVSGDGVDQDDVVTFFASSGFHVPATILRADQVFVDGVRLPYQKFNRNPEGGMPRR